MRRNCLLFVGTLTTLGIASSASAQSDEAEAPAAEVTATPAAADTTEPAPAATPGAAPAAQAQGDASYDLQMYELEDELNELKESVFASKARLRMLWNQLMQDRIGGSRIVVNHVNQLGGLLELEAISYSVDGNQVYQSSVHDDAGFPAIRELEIYSSPTLPGPHTVTVRAELRGNDHGLFSYMRGYQFVLLSSTSLTLEEGRTATIGVEVYDRGGSATLEERPNIRYAVDVVDSEPDALPAEEGGES